MFDASAPRVRVIGRRVSNGWANLETLWAGIGDSLYGFRVYPIRPLLAVMEPRRWMRRFDFDVEAAVRLVWRGLAPVNLPAPVRYFRPEEGGVSHFNYVRDNLLADRGCTRGCSSGSCCACLGLHGSGHAAGAGPDATHALSIVCSFLSRTGLYARALAARMAPNRRLRNAPTATVVPMALSTGARARDSSPKPITVDALHNASDSECALRIGAAKRLAFEEQRVVGPHAHHQEQSHQVENTELASAQL